MMVSVFSRVSVVWGTSSVQTTGYIPEQTYSEQNPSGSIFRITQYISREIPTGTTHESETPVGSTPFEISIFGCLLKVPLDMSSRRRFWSLSATGDVHAIETIVAAIPPEQLAALLRPSHSCASSTEERGRSNYLHYLCAGQKPPYRRWLMTKIGRGDVGQTGQRDEERSRILGMIVRICPFVLAMAVEPDEDGRTPLHCCVRSGSVKTLEELSLCICNHVGEERAAVLLATPSFSEGDNRQLTPFEFAVSKRQWRAAKVLFLGGLLSHRTVISLTGELVDHSCRPSSRRRGLPLAAASLGSSSGTVSETGPNVISGFLAGAIGVTINKFWDSWGGHGSDVQAVQWHKRAMKSYLQDQSEELGPHETEKRVIVLENDSQIERHMNIEITRASRYLNLSISEAMLFLQSHGWCISEDNLPFGQAPNEARKERPQLAAAHGERNSAVVDNLVVCIVCFEEFLQKSFDCVAASDMPCFHAHAVCADCWRGVLKAAVEEGRGNGAICPDCHLPLPLHTARELLRPHPFLYGSYRTLVLRHYVEAHPHMQPCPSAKCDRVILSDAGKSFDPRIAGKKKLENSCCVVQNVKCSCGTSFCFNCGTSPPHMPASCDQLARWTEELDRLRALAPSLDYQWLKSNAKKCPGCGIQCQKNGGCLHMTCPRCGAHWCWECLQPWSCHGSETGGFYFCFLDPIQARNEEVEAVEILDGVGSYGSSGEREMSPPAGTDPSHSTYSGNHVVERSGWLRGLISCMSNYASQEITQRSLRMYFSNECDKAGLRSTGEYMHQLMKYILPCSINRIEILDRSFFMRVLGVSITAAAEMTNREWSQSLLAASRSLADVSFSHQPMRAVDRSSANADVEQTRTGSIKLRRIDQWNGICDNGGPQVVSDVKEEGFDSASSFETSEEEIRGAAPCEGGSLGSKDKGTAPALHAYMDILGFAETIIEAHRLLQNSSAVLFRLSGGVRRKYLLELCEAIQQKLERLEFILLALPFRPEVLASIDVPCAAQRNQMTSFFLGSFRWLMRREIEFLTPAEQRSSSDHPELWIAKMSSEALVAQSLYLLSVLMEWHVRLRDEFVSLRRHMKVLEHAGGCGLFESDAVSGSIS